VPCFRPIHRLFKGIRFSPFNLVTINSHLSHSLTVV
jgi:hypothetical protein